LRSEGRFFFPLTLAWAVVVATGVSAAARAPVMAIMAIVVRADPERLDWSLFRRVGSIPGTPEDAHIAAEMSFPRALRVERHGDRYRMPSFTITVAPVLSRTMVRRAAGASRHLLRHEQGHYDLVVLTARALGRELDSLGASSAAELSRAVQEAVARHTARAERLSEAYDHATDRSRDARAQARWSEEIESAMRAPAPTEIAALPL
jgi:hypothetical protein